jgi:Rieske 2Fe-2S family protein
VPAKLDDSQAASDHSPMGQETVSLPSVGFRKTIETFVPGAMTLPREYFVAPQRFTAEMEKVFAREWICVGHQSQVAHPGDFLRREVAGESLIIIRDRQDEIRAHYNVCRHRGTRLLEEASGHCSAIQCPYHAWSYALDGRLVGAPHMDNVPGFRKEDYPLHSVHVGTWEGLIFVSLAKSPPPLGEVFAPLKGKFSNWSLPDLQSARRVDYDIGANWKLMFQNYSECYHCPGVHPALAKVSPYDSAENDLSEGPFLGGFMLMDKGRSLTMSGRSCAPPLGEMKAEDQSRIFYYSIFPNLLLSLHPDYVMVHLLWPQSPERTLISCDWYFHPDAARAKDNSYNPEDAVEFWDMTNRQDWHVCELSQQGISSRIYQPGPYSARESIPAAWDRHYLQVMGN